MMKSNKMRQKSKQKKSTINLNIEDFEEKLKALEAEGKSTVIYQERLNTMANMQFCNEGNSLKKCIKSIFTILFGLAFALGILVFADTMTAHIVSVFLK